MNTETSLQGTILFVILRYVDDGATCQALWLFAHFHKQYKQFCQLRSSPVVILVFLCAVIGNGGLERVLSVICFSEKFNPSMALAVICSATM